MQWNSLSEFLHMGGYALYVWGSFGVTALAIWIECAMLARQRREMLRAIRNDVHSDAFSDETTP